jgi:L-2,4-diaminobutyrate decarboxylase
MIGSAMPVPAATTPMTLADAFDPAAFQRLAGIILDKLAAYLDDASVRGLKSMDPLELTRQARSLMTGNQDAIAEPDPEQFARLVDLYIQTGIQVHSPGFMGRQFSGIVPLAGAIDLIGSVVNQPASFYEAGQLPNVAERIMAREFNRFLGWPEDSYDLVSTSGGTLGNLTAILAARNARYPDLWERGYHGLGAIPALAVSAECHYSITRAAGILGIGADQIIQLAIDGDRRIRPEAIEPALAAARARGLDVFCLVASAGTTSIGAIDPLPEIAAITRRHGLWLHVDGAHGASLLVSDALRERLRGLAEADSFIMDAHKLLFVPSACTLLFYRNRRDAAKAFKQEASYVFEKEGDCQAAFDSAGKNFECTKRPAIMNLWAIWALYGPALFARKIDYLVGLAADFHRFLCAQADFRALHAPQINIVCFRYQPAALAPDRLSLLQDRIRERINLDNRFFISKVDLDGVAALRVVFMNHRITREHYAGLIAAIRAAGHAILEELARES